MGILNYLKKIYSGKENLFNHISLFSIFGIMAICLGNRFFAWYGGTYFGHLKLTNVGLYWSFVIGLVLLIFSIGYVFEVMHNAYDEEYNLPEISLSGITTFVKILPLFIVWGMYVALIAALGFVIFPVDSNRYYVYNSLILLLSPFMGVIFAIYARDFEYKIEYFNPLYIFKILDKSFFEVLKLFIKTFLILIFALLVVCLLFIYSNDFEKIKLALIMRFGALCFAAYALNIIQYVYVVGLTNIVNKKFPLNN
ncbi:hypothetical protein IJ579_00095 [bacterium]|nr:hypothetical protein [bacterium]